MLTAVDREGQYWKHDNIVALLRNNDNMVESILISYFTDSISRFIQIISKDNFDFIQNRITRQAIEQGIKDIKNGSLVSDYELNIFQAAVNLVEENNNLKNFQTTAEKNKFLDAAYMKARVLENIEADPTAFITRTAAQELATKHLKEENNRLQEDNASLQALVGQQRAFISKVVHEASSHIRFIFFNMNRLFQVKYTPEKEAEYGDLLYTIKQYIQQHKILFQNLSDFSSTAYGSQIIFKIETVSVNSYIHNILDEYSFYIEGLGHSLEIQSPELSFEAKLDRIRFRQVVHNLILNAIKHGEKGLIKAVINCHSPEKTWSLTITNPFLPYTQTESYRNGQLGLGLQICKELVEGMNGTIESQQAKDLYTVTLLMSL